MGRMPTNEEKKETKFMPPHGYIDRPPNRANALAWAIDTFGPITTNRTERACRFVEEAIELAHAEGLSAAVLCALIGRVYARPAGDLETEIGQAALTLEMLAENACLSVDRLADAEFRRVTSIPKEEWQRRHAAKVARGIAA